MSHCENLNCFDFQNPNIFGMRTPGIAFINWDSVFLFVSGSWDSFQPTLLLLEQIGWLECEGVEPWVWPELPESRLVWLWAPPPLDTPLDLKKYFNFNDRRKENWKKRTWSLTYWQRKAGLESVTTWKIELTEVVWAFGWQYSLAEA